MFQLEEQQNVFNSLSDNDREFPKRAFCLLNRLNLLKVTLPEEYDGRNLGTSIGNEQLLEILKNIGRADLSVGRIYEGHINALLLIQRYATSAQKKKYYKDAAEGKLFSIWNTERSFEEMKISKKDEGFILKGAKIFCSGGKNIQRPIVTAKGPKGSQMIILEMENLPHLEEDWSLWKPTGMRASVSCRLDFSNITVRQDQLLGKAEDYSKEPDFSGGAIRFAAVQLGGAEAMANAAMEHLKNKDRETDPYQKVRLARITILLESGRLWLAEVGKMAEKGDEISIDALLNYSNMVRTAILDICTEVMQLAEQSVGLSGFIRDHPLEKLHRDLTTYLKQPGPDQALVNVGEYAAQLKDLNNVK
mgnify:CR=1 FL=1